MKLIQNKLIRTIVLVLAVGVLSVGGGFLGSRLASPSSPQGSSELVMHDSAGVQKAPSRGTGGTIEGDAVSSAFQERFRSVASSTLPVVVELNVMNTVTQPVAISPFDFFFGTPNGRQPREREYTQRGLGSGVIVARSGDTLYVLTNNHVAGDADEIEVVLDDERVYEGSLVGSDELMDLALVSFRTADDIPVASLGDSDALEVGDWVFAVGNPLGFQSSVTAGIVSAKYRNAQPGSGTSGVTSYIQTDAAINQGNSGGALVDMNGNVVGINTWIASQNGGSIGLGFAIPINAAKKAISDFIESGSVSYSWLGVQTGDPSGELSADLGIEGVKGAFVYGVYADSPAGKSGLLPGDLIVSIDGKDIPDGNALVRTVAALDPGKPAVFQLRRGGDFTEVTVRTERRGENSGSDASKLWPGISVVPLTDDLKKQLSLDRSDQGVVVAGINTESVAGGGGLQQGDLVTEVNGTAVRSAKDFYSGIGRDGEDVTFRVKRAGKSLIFGFEKPSP